MNDISYVISSGTDTNGGSLVLNNVANNATVEFIGSASTASNVTDVNLTDATGTTDSLNVVTKVSAADLNFGTLDAAGIESISLTATDTATTTINRATVTVKDAALKTMTIGGNSNVTLILDAATVALTSVNASSMTGALTATTNGTVAQTITGGAGADSLTSAAQSDVLNGGAGSDTLTVGAGSSLVTLTGGSGSDTFAIGRNLGNVNSYATITDLSAGDKLLFATGANTFNSSKVTLQDTAVFQDYANAAINNTNAGDITWFQLGGNTYVIQNVADGSSFNNAQDIIVRITGLVDLSTASFSSSADTLQIN